MSVLMNAYIVLCMMIHTAMVTLLIEMHEIHVPRHIKTEIEINIPHFVKDWDLNIFPHLE